MTAVRDPVGRSDDALQQLLRELRMRPSKLGQAGRTFGRGRRQGRPSLPDGQLVHPVVPELPGRLATEADLKRQFLRARHAEPKDSTRAEDRGAISRAQLEELPDSLVLIESNVFLQGELVPGSGSVLAGPDARTMRAPPFIGERRDHGEVEERVLETSELAGRDHVADEVGRRPSNNFLRAQSLRSSPLPRAPG